MSQLRGELMRKAVHISMGGFALLFRWITPGQAAILAIAALLFNLFVLHRLTRRALLRENERGSGYSLGIVLYPAVVLVVIGIFRERRAERKAKERGEQRKPAFPIIDLNIGKTRKAVLVFLFLTMANVVILATATYKGVEVMDSTTFCGTACHTVMMPELAGSWKVQLNVSSSVSGS